MKKFKYLFLSLGIILTACQTEEQPSTEIINVPKSGNTVGEEHNAQLANYYTSLASFVNANGANNVTNTHLRNILNSILTAYVTIPNGQTIINGALSSFDDFINSASFATSMTNMDNRINSISKPKAVSTFLNNFWAGCITVSNLQQCNTYCAQQKSIANATFTGISLLTTLGAVDVFGDTYAYWNTNYSIWYLLMNPGGSVPQGMINNVSAADAKGFVIGVLVANNQGYGPLACEMSGIAYSVAYSAAAALK